MENYYQTEYGKFLQFLCDIQGKYVVSYLASNFFISIELRNLETILELTWKLLKNLQSKWPTNVPDR